jgi:hypothetical protein
VFNEEVLSLNKRLDGLLLREEIMWKQRSRITWIKLGDQNTKFFHRKASWRQKNNKINSLQNADGLVVDNQSELENMAKNYFEGMHKKEEYIFPEMIEELFEHKVDHDMNKHLIRDFTDDEIGDALFQTGPLKEPGADGFPARFFQRNWGIL